mmetsp:Transcript_50946/g.165019  ORF Transcript_50946/g.165019 Transcript_50946/m.165019 type:complete len:281 (-) Transcript_50946:306-1148(-)
MRDSVANFDTAGVSRQRRDGSTRARAAARRGGTSPLPAQSQRERRQGAHPTVPPSLRVAKSFAVSESSAVNLFAVLTTELEEPWKAPPVIQSRPVSTPAATYLPPVTRPRPANCVHDAGAPGLSGATVTWPPRYPPSSVSGSPLAPGLCSASAGAASAGAASRRRLPPRSLLQLSSQLRRHLPLAAHHAKPALARQPCSSASAPTLAIGGLVAATAVGSVAAAAVGGIAAGAASPSLKKQYSHHCLFIWRKVQTGCVAERTGTRGISYHGNGVSAHSSAW